MQQVHNIKLTQCIFRWVQWRLEKQFHFLNKKDAFLHDLSRFYEFNEF